MAGSGIFLARHTWPYETWNQVGQLCLGLQAQLMYKIFPHLFLKNAICRFEDTLKSSCYSGQLPWFMGMKAASILSEVWKSDFTEVKTNGSPQGGKLLYFWSFWKGSCSTWKLLKRLLVYGEAQGSQLWASAWVALYQLINWLSFLSRKKRRY